MLKMQHHCKKIFFVYFVLCGLFAQVKLTVNAIPKRAEVLLDGKSIGKTPIHKAMITTGEHKFEINKSGFAPLIYDLIVNPSEAVHLDFFLNPIYKVKFKTDEKGLIFELNGEHRWDDDLIRLKLEAGNHLLRVFKLGIIIDEQTILVDEPKTFRYFLKKPISEE
jgi:hypothetical protein